MAFVSQLAIQQDRISTIKSARRRSTSATGFAIRHKFKADIQTSVDDVISNASLILFTTTTPAPYVGNERLFEHAPTVIHLSLRDICVNVILASQNIVDDVDHCLKAGTSLHLTETAIGKQGLYFGHAGRCSE